MKHTLCNKHSVNITLYTVLLQLYYNYIIYCTYITIQYKIKLNTINTKFTSYNKRSDNIFLYCITVYCKLCAHDNLR